MKKYTVLLVMFLLVGLILVACGAEPVVDNTQIDAANNALAAAEAAAANAQATAAAAAAALEEAQAAGSEDDAAVAELQAQLEAAQAAQEAAEAEADASASAAATAAAESATNQTEQPASTFSGQLPVDVPREEVFVVDQIFRYNVAGNYNIWTSSGTTPHRHAMMNETLWITDQETGQRLYDAAVSDPMYNDDFTQMTVELRDNIYWSDGVQFTADDLIFTVDTLMTIPELGQSGWSVQLNNFVESAEKIDDFTVQFNLTQSSPRFHTLFEARWNGVYMMPKHIMENVDDLGTWAFEEPVVLGAYIPTQFDPNGFWELYERREDWEQSPAGVLTGNPGPQYVLTIFYGDSTRKAIAMSRGELDVFFDADFEAFASVLDATDTARSWYNEFPWAYPNEVSTRQFAFNLDKEPYNNKDVRWALALALDIVTLQTEYIGGVAKVTAMPIPPTASLVDIYLDPMEEWLQNLEIEIESGEMYQPYDPTVPDRIAEWAEGQGYTVPGTPREVFGTGWWKYDPEVAERLLLKNGFSRNDSEQWLLPSGEVWTIDLQSPPDENDAFRMANAATDMWGEFGITVNLQGLERSVWEQNGRVGQYDISTPWYSFALANGDSWPEVRGWHTDLYVPNGENFQTSGGGNLIRISDPQIGEYIDSMVPINPDDPANFELVQEFLQYWTENMYFITAISFKKFVTWDERFWTGFPTSEEPNFMPLYWFQGGKYAIQSLEPVGGTTSSN
jgi:peptide/nickel transport system substrate-binding protein